MVGNQSKMTPARSAQLQGLLKTNMKPKSKGKVFIHFLVNDVAINTRSYIRNCFGRLTSSINVINAQKSTSGTKNMKFHHDDPRIRDAKCVKSYLKRKGFTIIRRP
jgi:hypothetical protein